MTRSVVVATAIARLARITVASAASSSRGSLLLGPGVQSRQRPSGGFHDGRKDSHLITEVRGS